MVFLLLKARQALGLIYQNLFNFLLFQEKTFISLFFLLFFCILIHLFIFIDFMHFKFLERFVDTQKIFNEGYETAMSQVQKIKEEADLQEKHEIILKLENKIDKLVICISPETPNLIVGFIKDIIFKNKSNQPTLMIHDLINNQDIIPIGIVMVYTEQKFHALNKLSFHERLAIFFHQENDENITIPTFQSPPVDPQIWAEKTKEIVDYWLSHKV